MFDLDKIFITVSITPKSNIRILTLNNPFLPLRAAPNLKNIYQMFISNNLRKKCSTKIQMTIAKSDLSDSKDEQEIQVHNMQASLATIQSKLNAAQQELKLK